MKFTEYSRLVPAVNRLLQNCAYENACNWGNADAVFSHGANIS